MSIQHNFCFCSNEMQQSRIWRAKQNERNNYQNKNYRKLNQNYPKLFIERQIELIKQKYIN